MAQKNHKIFKHPLKSKLQLKEALLHQAVQAGKADAMATSAATATATQT